jgi:hypothetical protein
MLLAGGLAAVSVPVAAGTSETPFGEGLSGLFSSPHSAMAIGAAYLREHPSPGQTLESLRAAVLMSLRLSDADLHRLGRRALAGRFRRQVRQDFADGDVVMVEDWMLSRLEVQVCAITCLAPPAG